MKKIFEMVVCVLLLTFSVANAAPQRVDLSSIAGRKFQAGELYADILGISGTVPKTAVIDFDANLKKMWKKKLNRRKGVTDVAEDSARPVIDYYAKHKTKMSLKDYVAWIHRDIEGLKANIDWVGLCGVRLRGQKCAVLQELAKGIYGKDLVAYGLTELMPSADGRLNVLILEILLKNAGREYLDSIPALYDKYTSLGMWQFTQFAVYHTAREVRGASHVNLYVKSPYKIPGSVIHLRNSGHHRAAYMFAVSNLTDLVRTSNGAELANLSRNHGKHLDEIVQFIATAHHLPANAVTGARRWAANNMRSSLQVSLGPKLARYAKKTQANLLALYQMIK